MSKSLTSKLAALVKSQVKRSMGVYHQNRIAETVEVIEKFANEMKKPKSKIERIWAIVLDANEPSQFTLLVDDLRKSTKHLLDGIYLMMNERDTLIAEGLKNFNEIINSVLLSKVEIENEKFKSHRRGCYFTVFRRELESYKASAFEYLDEVSSQSKAQFIQQIDALSARVSEKVNVVASAYQKCSRVEASEKCLRSFMKVSLKA